ncbi:MAG: hypothetical protein A2X77_00025 [Gammaproteobacteria bacterium GWE2_42_36]|nr:MAG: hypothetical protein A2X77_00025 [Gammaproteobacteria bacterium GWE2_42_36]HCU04968.1 hypothetical protein [Coxiellaceae bacterium]
MQEQQQFPFGSERQFSYASEADLIASPATQALIGRIDLPPQTKIATSLPYFLSPQGLMEVCKKTGTQHEIDLLMVESNGNAYMYAPRIQEDAILKDIHRDGVRFVNMGSTPPETRSFSSGDVYYKKPAPRYLWRDGQAPSPEKTDIIPPPQGVKVTSQWKHASLAHFLQFQGPQEIRGETTSIPKSWLRLTRGFTQRQGLGGIMLSISCMYTDVAREVLPPTMQIEDTVIDRAIVRADGVWMMNESAFSVKKRDGELILIGRVEDILQYNEVVSENSSVDRVWQYSDHSARFDDPAVLKVMYGQLAPMDFVLADNILKSPTDFKFQEDYAWCSASVERKQQILWLALSRDVSGRLMHRVSQESSFKRLLQGLPDGDVQLLQDVLQKRVEAVRWSETRGMLLTARQWKPLATAALAEANRGYDYQMMVSYLKNLHLQPKQEAIEVILRTAQQYQARRIAPFFANFLRRAVYAFQDTQYVYECIPPDLNKIFQSVEFFNITLSKKADIVNKICQFQNNPLFVQFMVASFGKCAIRLSEGAACESELNAISRDIEIFEIADNLAGSVVNAPEVNVDRQTDLADIAIESFLANEAWIFASHEDKRKILCLAMAMDKTKNLEHRLLPTSLALAHFSQREFEVLQSLEQIKWKDRGRDGAALYQKVHLLKSTDISYTQEAFGDQEVAFLAALLDAENLPDESGQRLSAKLVPPESNIIRDVVLCFDEDERDYAGLRYYVGERRTEAVAAEDRIYAFEMPNAIRILQTMVQAINPAAFGKRKDSATSVQETAQRIIEEINQRFSSSEDRMLPKNAFPLLKSVFDSLQRLNPEDTLAPGAVLKKLEAIEQQLYPLGARLFGTLTPQQGRRAMAASAPWSAPATMREPHRVDLPSEAPSTSSSPAPVRISSPLGTPSPASSPVQGQLPVEQPTTSAKLAEKPAKRPGRLARIFGGIMMVVGAVLAVTIVGLIPGMIVAGIGAIVYTAGEARAMKAEAAASQEERQKTAVAASPSRTPTQVPVEPASSAIVTPASPQGTATGPEALSPSRVATPTQDAVLSPEATPMPIAKTRLQLQFSTGALLEGLSPPPSPRTAVNQSADVVASQKRTDEIAAIAAAAAAPSQITATVVTTVATVTAAAIAAQQVAAIAAQQVATARAQETHEILSVGGPSSSPRT